MPSNAVKITDFISALHHPKEELILYLRNLILNLDESPTESIKWNAPNFSFRGEDRITFNFPPKKDHVRLILHFGARKKVDAQSALNCDFPSNFSWLASDRAMMTFTDIKSTERIKDEIIGNLNIWIGLTKE